MRFTTLDETTTYNRNKNKLLIYSLHFFGSSLTDGVFVLRRGLRRSTFTGNEALLFEDIISGFYRSDRG